MSDNEVIVSKELLGSDLVAGIATDIDKDLDGITVGDESAEQNPSSSLYAFPPGRGRGRGRSRSSSRSRSHSSSRSRSRSRSSARGRVSATSRRGGRSHSGARNTRTSPARTRHGGGVAGNYRLFNYSALTPDNRTRRSNSLAPSGHRNFMATPTRRALSAQERAASMRELTNYLNSVR